MRGLKSKLKNIEKKLNDNTADTLPSGFIKESSHAISHYLKGGHELEKAGASKDEVKDFEEKALKEINKIDAKYNRKSLGSKSLENKIKKWSEKYGL